MTRFLFIVGVFFSLNALGQNPIVGGSVSNGGVMNGMSATVATFDLSASKKVSSFYLDEDWKTAELWNQKGEKVMEEHFVKYDILNNELNFRIGQKEMVAPQGVVSKFVIKDIAGPRTFAIISASNWKLSETPFFEVLVDGQLQLLVHYQAELVKPNYNTALNVGSKTTTVKHKEVLYLLDGGVLTKLPKKSKARAKLLAKYSVNDYVKQHKLNLKDKNDLIKTVQFINQ